MKTPVTFEEKIDYIYYHTKIKNRNSAIFTVFKSFFYGAIMIFLILSFWSMNKDTIINNIKEITKPIVIDITKEVVDDSTIKVETSTKTGLIQNLKKHSDIQSNLNK